MHDWALTDLTFNWETACVTIRLSWDSVSRTVTADGVSELLIPRANEWGPSVSVNKVSEVETLPSGLKQLLIEMQSGDIIRIVAKRFALPV